MILKHSLPICFIQIILMGAFAGLLGTHSTAADSPNKENAIPNCMLCYKFGPEQTIIIVEKSTQSLFVYSNYNPEPIERFKITSGKNNGRKLEEGDMKTPEGLYYFTKTLTGNQLPKVDDYGEKAFILNYPNPIDSAEKRNGSGIWLHGAFNSGKTSNPNNSRGCVVLENNELKKVSKYISLNRSPICIYDKIVYDSAEKLREKREYFLNNLKEWKTNWEEKEIDDYIAYYNDTFTYNGMNLNQFKAVKASLNQKYRFIRVLLMDINLYSFDGYYMVMFNQLYVSDQTHFYNKKIQYWKESPTIPKMYAEDTINIGAISNFELADGRSVTIDQYRKECLSQLNKGSEIVTGTMSTIIPDEISLISVAAQNDSVKLKLRKRGSTKDLKVIPVARYVKDNHSVYHSLSGVELNEGRPNVYSGGTTLTSETTQITVAREAGYTLKSVTLFVVKTQQEPEQILTYFVNI